MSELSIDEQKPDEMLHSAHRCCFIANTRAASVEINIPKAATGEGARAGHSAA